MDLLTHMATFVSIVDGKSLSAAARARGMSLPATSRQLRALEADLGAQLIVRSTRRLHVTDAGQAFYTHAARLLRDVDVARSVVSDAGAVAGRLVVSASLTFGQLEIVPRLRLLAERHPRLSVDLRLQDNLVDLVGEGVDIAIRAGVEPPDSTAYVAHPLSELRRVLVASPSHLRKHGAVRAPEQLKDRICLVQVTLGGVVIPWRLQRSEPHTRPANVASQTDEVHTFEVEGQLRCNAPLTLRDLAVAGSGIAYLPEFVVGQDLAAGQLKRVLPEWTSPVLHIAALHRTTLRDVPRVRAFLDVLRQRGGRR